MANFDDRYVVDATTGCWNWTGPINNRNYGRHGRGYAHRFSYARAHGPIPTGLVIDHLCRNTRCCNPAHLEAVTQRENVRRSPATFKDQCVNGHDLTDENSYFRPNGARRCRTCFKASRYRDRGSPVRPTRRHRDSKAPNNSGHIGAAG